MTVFHRPNINVPSVQSGFLSDNNVTVNFDNSMSAAEMQSEIDRQPKFLNGKSITFQFADGTYNLTDKLRFYGFAGGIVNVYGNSSDNTLSTTKSVHLNGSSISSSGGVLHFYRCHTVVPRYMKITVPNVTDFSGVACYHSVVTYAQYNYFLGVAKTNACFGSNVEYGTAYWYSNYVSNLYAGFVAARCIAFIYNNDEAGTDPNYGQISRNGAQIGQLGTQPAGSVANQSDNSGGTIYS